MKRKRTVHPLQRTRTRPTASTRRQPLANSRAMSSRHLPPPPPSPVSRRSGFSFLLRLTHRGVPDTKRRAQRDATPLLRKVHARVQGVALDGGTPAFARRVRTQEPPNENRKSAPGRPRTPRRLHAHNPNTTQRRGKRVAMTMNETTRRKRKTQTSVTKKDQ